MTTNTAMITATSMNIHMLMMIRNMLTNMSTNIYMNTATSTAMTTLQMSMNTVLPTMDLTTMVMTGTTVITIHILTELC